jgi:hypothetical protein
LGRSEGALPKDGLFSPCRGMCLELRPRPMSREHARPQPQPPLAGSRRAGTGEGQRTLTQRTEEPAPAPVPVGVTGHRTQRPSGQPPPPPGPHPAQPGTQKSEEEDPAPHSGLSQRAHWRTVANTAASGLWVALAPLIAQLVRRPSPLSLMHGTCPSHGQQSATPWLVARTSLASRCRCIVCVGCWLRWLSVAV